MSSVPPFATGQKAAASARIVLFGLLMGGLAAGCLIAAVSLRSSVHGVRTPVASLTALLLLAAIPVADRLAAWMRVPVARLATALAFLGLAPFLALGAALPLSEPIITAHWHCGTGDVQLAMLAILAFPLFGATSALLAVVVAKHAGRRVFGLLRVGRLAALGLSGLLLAGAALRAVQRPDPDHYLAAMPEVATLPAAASKEPSETFLPSESPYPDRAGEVRLYVDIVDEREGELMVLRACAEGRCTVSLRLSERRGHCGVAPKWTPQTFDEKEPVALFHDAKHDLWVVGGRLAFRGFRGTDRKGDFDLTDINVNDVADELSPPVGWIGVGAAGLLIAAAVAFRRRRLQRRLAALGEAKVGVHGRDGWIAFDESLPAFRAAPDLDLPEGPVLIVAGQGGGLGGGTYRSDGPLGQVEILPGAREDILTAQRGRIAVLDAFAVSALLLTAAPLITAALRGLL